MLTEGNLSEFHGYTGDCGFVAALAALHGLDPAHYSMSAVLLTHMVKVAISHGQAGPQGQATINNLNWLLTWWYGCQTRVYPYTGGELAGWRELLAEHAGVHPVILQLRHGGVLPPQNDPNLWYHFITQLGSLSFADGDHAAGTGEGAMCRYSLDDLERAAVCGAIVIYNTQPMRAAATIPAPAPAPRHYAVANGDTLGEIATRLHLANWFSQLYKPNAAVIEAAARLHGRPNSGMGHWIYPGTILSY